MSVHISIHNIGKIEIETSTAVPDALVLKIADRNDWRADSTIILFTGDETLASALAIAINRVVAERALGTGVAA